MNHRGSQDAHQCRNRIAADDRPWLRQRTGRHGKQQDGRSAHRRHDQRQVWSLPEQITADQTGQADTDQRADTGNEPLAQGGTGQDRYEHSKTAVRFWLLRVGHRETGHAERRDRDAGARVIPCPGYRKIMHKAQRPNGNSPFEPDGRPVSRPSQFAAWFKRGVTNLYLWWRR